MNRKLWIFAALLVSGLMAFLAGRHTSTTPESDTALDQVGAPEVLYWVAPMDPNFRRNEPGKSPMGMDLIPVFSGNENEQAGVVTIDPAIVNNLGVRTAVAEFGPLSRQIDTVGYVEYDEHTLQHIHTRVDGWVENLATRATGDRVTKGELLFELYSPTLVNAQEEYLAAVQSGNSGLIVASRKRLTALGVADGEIERLDSTGLSMRTIPVYSGSDGIVAKLGVRDGIFVTPATDVMSIAKLDRVWVIAEVFERQAAWVKPGQLASVSLDYRPGDELEGVVDYLYPELDPITRTLRVRLRFENVAEDLLPNMFAKVLIYGRSSGDIVHVPREAVVRDGATNRVVIALGHGRYRSREVTLGIESGDRIAIRSGLREGENVVSSAQFLIDSESNIRSSLDRLGSSGSESQQ